MKGKRFILFLMTGCMASVAWGQRIIGELESNSDMMSLPTAGLNDSTSSKKEKEVPVELRAWTIDKIYGNITPTVIDTMMHQFQNKALGEGLNGHYNTLSNLGSPRINRIFMERNEHDDFVFLDPFDFFYVPSDKFLYYNTKCPYVNAEYKVCGSKTTGFDDFTVLFTNNAGKRVNFGGKFKYLYGNGYYDNQETAFMEGSGWVSYLGDKYDLHLQYTHDYMKMAENGGIEDETYITHPEEIARSFTSNDIPTRLSQTWMRQEHNIVHLNHRYNVGFYRTEGEDSASMKDVFVPIASLFHTLHFNTARRIYKSNIDTPNFHTFQYLPGDTTNDKTKATYIKNIVGLSLREGFNKWAAAGLNVYIGMENRKYELPDTADGGSQFVSSYKEHDVMIGGQIIRTQGSLLHLNINGEMTLTGDHSGDFFVKGTGELNVPFRMFNAADTMQVQVNAYVKDATPGFYFRHFHSRNAWWDNNLDKEFRTRIEGVFSLPHTGTTVTAGVENLKNYTYFQNCGLPYIADSKQGFSNNAMAMQCDENVQVFSVNLRQNFKWKILHFDNDITFQKSSNDKVIPLPTLSTYHNLYITGQLVKNVLKAELGADVKFFTKYNAPDYSPAITQYVNQNPDNLREIGAYPLISVYAAFDLKQLRAYIQYYHLNQKDGEYFWAPGYPMDPSSIRFGLSWNFYD